MPTKKKPSTKKSKATATAEPPKQAVEEKPIKPQFVTEVVEDLPVNEGVDVPKEDLETIKKDAEEIQDVVTEIEEKKEEAEEVPHAEPEAPKQAVVEEADNGETEPSDVAPSPAEKKAQDKEVLAEIFTKEKAPAIYPDITAHKRSGAAPVFLWAVIIIAVALLTGGTLLVVASGLPKLPTLFAKPTPTPTPAPTPSPTPAAAAARGDIKLQVLNGGGTAGSAGKAKTFLEEKGYTVEAVGNTDEYTYDETEIHVKSGKEAFLELLKTDLADEYTLGTTAADLAADSPYDAQVIVGKQ